MIRLRSSHHHSTRPCCRVQVVRRSSSKELLAGFLASAGSELANQPMQVRADQFHTPPLHWDRYTMLCSKAATSDASVVLIAWP
jgi:hypothetical protein